MILKRGGWPFANPPNSQFTLNTMSPQARGLVAWWPTIASFGSNVLRDVSGTGLHGTLVDITYRMNPTLGPGLHCPGTNDDEVLVPDHPALDFTADMTISTWALEDAEVSWKTILHRGSNYWLRRLNIVVDAFQFLWYDGVNLRTAATPNGTLVAQTLYHIAAVIRSNDIEDIYLNGVPQNVVPAGAGGGGRDNTQPLHIGMRAGGADAWNGFIGDTRLYNRAFSAAEVYALYDPATRWKLYRPVPQLWVGVSLIVSGETTWGHDTGVLETNVRDFSGNWTGTGTVELAGDSERLRLDAGENMVSEVIDTGTETVELLQNNYDPTGDDVDLDYRHGATEAACLAAGWNNYTVPFVSLGFVQIRVTSTL